MSFFGKKFKRVKSEGLEELMDAINIDEKMRGLAKAGGDSYTVFLKNDDGTYSFSMRAGDKEVTNNTFKFDEEVDLTRPDGVVVRTRYHLDGDTLTQTLTDPEGRHFTFLREYSGSSLKMTITVAEMDVKATMYFEEV